VGSCPALEAGWKESAQSFEVFFCHENEQQKQTLVGATQK
jgi:hypothetical protein